MKANEIMTSAKRTFSKVGFGLQKKSPEILVGVGIVGAVASAVLACKATTKAGAIVEESKNSLADIRKANENGITKAGESYSAEDRRKDLAIAYVQTGVKFAKLYAPAVMLGAVSIASILASHNIMKKRNVALAAAYAAVDKSFKDYRDRVIERFGEQVEKELRYNIKAQEIEETVTDDKGKEKKVKQNVNVAGENWDGSDYGPYAKVFDDTHSDWKQDPEMNLFYLRARQAQANDMLKSQGHLFLNEVYDILRCTIEMLNAYRESYLETKDKQDWWQMIQLLPSSYNQRRTVMLNYEVLANMYKSRRNHKLDEWHTFCDWIESLPYSELIAGKQAV